MKAKTRVRARKLQRRPKKAAAKTPARKSQQKPKKALARREAGPSQQGPPKSEYNPRGLKAADILKQIRQAYEYTPSFPEELQDCPCKARRGRFLNLDTADVSPSDRFDGRAVVVRSWNLLDADESTCGPDDPTLAREICGQPMRLFFSDTHADAVARWVYGKTHGIRGTTRMKAAQFLKTAFPTRSGAPVSFRGDAKMLRQAYDDLVAYGNGLRACLRQTGNPYVLATHFPDCAELKKYLGRSPETLIGAAAREIPTGIQIAESVFAGLVGWSHAQIQKKLRSP